MKPPHTHCLRLVGALLLAGGWLGGLTAAETEPTLAATGTVTNAPAPPTLSASQSIAAVNAPTAPMNAPAASARAPMSEPAAPAQRLDFSAFRLISDRNIFNPNRRAWSRETEPRRAARVDGFSLLGTLIHEGGSFAFFDGTDSSFKRVLKPAARIGDFRIMEIAPTFVTLQAASNTFKLAIGMQMKRQEDEDWRLVAGGGPWGTPSLAATTKEKPAGAEPAGGGSDDEVLKRLLQKHEQEFSK